MKKNVLTLFNIICLLSLPFQGFSQFTYELSGTVVDDKLGPIEGAFVNVEGRNKSAVTDRKGKYRILLDYKGKIKVSVSHVEFVNSEKGVDINSSRKKLDFRLKPDVKVLKQIEISTGKTVEKELNASEFKIKLNTITDIPSPFKDISKLIITLPGVSGNNEFSSTYSVRGGNFDENLIYINDIPVYRPFLIRAGRQEGLSFVNPDLVQDLSFSAGGWTPKHGDRLSSVLDVKYKSPDEFHASASIGLLTGSFHIEGSTRNDRLTYLAGYRRKDTRVLLNTLETEAQYLPTFDDFQGILSYDFSKLKNKGTTIDLFSLYARNRYLTVPETRVTDFGSVQSSLRFTVGLEGQEILNYDTYQGGITLKHRFSERVRVKWINSYVRTLEIENFEVSSLYELCDVDNDLGSDSFDLCRSLRGLGALYDFGRNKLEAELLGTELKAEFVINDFQSLEFGVSFRNEEVNDRLDEYSFADSSGFVIIEGVGLGRRRNNINLSSQRSQAYVQYQLQSYDSLLKITAGIRAHYWNTNGQILFSPRVQGQITLGPEKRWSLKAATGIYHQPPFYRELRNRTGEVNIEVLAQSSIHFVLGADHYFTMWGRDFKLSTEAYYKWLWNVNPYDIDNVKIRYFATNDANAFAMGTDFRLNGQFIPGAESWFSLSFLNTKEDIATDTVGFISRPSNQLMNLSVFFQDYMPNNPSVRVNVNLNYGSRLRFGPPLEDDLRNFFKGDSYLRLDMGFSKIFTLKKEPAGIKNISLGADVLNVLGSNNAISYIWIRDVIGNNFAVPNSLSARFLNLKMTVNI